MSGSSFTNVFGGNPVKPSNPQYEALAITANTALYWPLETLEGVPVVAALMDVSASTGGLKLIMPPANQGSSGVAAIIANIGANTFSVTDNGGNVICSPTASQAWVVALTDNTTTNGVWRAYQLASTTSSASAAALAGYGLAVEAVTKLMVSWTRSEIGTDTLLTVGTRCNDIVWTGGIGTLQLDTVANLGDGYIVAIRNEGTSNFIEISTSGSDTINGGASVSLYPGDSVFVIGGTSGGIGKFGTFGLTPSPLAIVKGGTGATSAAAALTALGGTAIGTAIFTAPSASSVIALLGLQNFTFTESTVGTNQVLSGASTGTAFVCTAAISLTIPLTTSQTVTWCFAFLAFNGAVTLIPQSSDSIMGGSAGAHYVVPNGSSGLVVTDANGNLFVLFTGGGSTGQIPWVFASGTGDAIAATYNPAVTSLTDGLLLSFRAYQTNATATPTFAPNGLAAQPITFDGGYPLQPGAIPGGLAECLVRYNSANSRWELLNPAIPLDQFTIVSVAGNANINLTPAQTSTKILQLTGVLTGNIDVFFPAVTGQWSIFNSTTGAFTISVGAVGGVGVLPITQGKSRLVATDGTNTYSVITDPLDIIPQIDRQQTFTTPGAIAFVVPLGVTAIRASEVLGAGGGGGASSNAGGSAASVASGGNRGTLGGGWLAVTPGATVTGTIGTGGAGGTVTGGAGGNGTDGGQTTFGPITSPGGHAGLGDGSAAAAPFLTQSNPGGTNVSSGGAWSYGEVQGQPGIALTNTNVMGGPGGGPGGGPASANGGAGQNATSSGGGGGGASTVASGTGAAGGLGGDGRVVVEW